MSFERESRLLQFVVSYAQRATADVSEGEMDIQPLPGLNPPRWILGHVCVTLDYAAEIVGLKRECPDAWHAAFAPGSPASGGDCRPAKDGLLGRLLSNAERVLAAIPSAPAAVLDAPTRIQFFEGTAIKSNADVLAHLLTTHPALHMGQLSYWRRCTGRPALF